MADLHKFQDDVKTSQSRAQPIVARHLDENFRKVRLEIADNLSGFLQIAENSPQADTIEFVTPPPASGEYAAVFRNGVFSQWMQIDECP